MNESSLLDGMLEDDCVVDVDNYEMNLTDEFEKWLEMYTQALENEKAGMPGASRKRRYLEEESMVLEFNY